MSEPDAAAEWKPSRRQRLGDLAALFVLKRGELPRPKRLLVLGEMVGRELSSTKRLTPAEVDLLATRLSAEPDCKVCPTPRKIRYATALSAGRGANSASVLRGGQYKPYKCPCGWWHLTSHVRGGRLQVSSDGTLYWKRKKRPEGGK